MEIFRTTPLSIQIAAQATSLDNIKIEPVDNLIGSTFQKTRVIVLFPGDEGSGRVGRVCANTLNKDIDFHRRECNAKKIEVGTLARVIERNWLFAFVVMEYKFS